MIVLDTHVGARKERGGKTDQRRQGNQENVERVDVELVFEQQQRPMVDDPLGQRRRREQRQQAAGGIDFRCMVAMPDQRQHQ